MRDAVRLGIVGLGAQGSMYGRLIADGRVPGMVIGALCDSDPEALARGQEQHPGVPAHADLTALLASGEVDAVVTCVPHYLHPEIGIAALRGAASTPWSRSRPASTPGRSTSSTRTRPQAPGADLRDHVQPAQQPAVPADQGDRRQRRDRRDPPHQLDHHHLVAAAGLLRPERLARHLGRRGRRASWSTRPRTSSTCGSGSAACRSRCTPRSAYGFRRDIAVEDEVTAVVDYGDGATGIFVTATHDLVGTDRFEILGDKRQDRRRGQQDRHRHPAEQAGARAQRLDGHGRTSASCSGRARHRPDLYTAGDHRVRLRLGRPARRRAGELRGQHPATAPRCSLPARTASTASGWPTPSTCPAGPAARCRWTSTRTSTSPSSTRGSAPRAPSPSVPELGPRPRTTSRSTRRTMPTAAVIGCGDVSVVHLDALASLPDVDAGRRRRARRGTP